MKSSRRFRHFSSSTTTTTTTKTVPYTFRNDHSSGTEVEQSSSKPIPITVHLRPSESTAAVKIQARYRSHLIRPLVRKISAVNSEANYWQRIIQRQETVDAVRTNERERIMINEALMGLLLKLDSVPGIDPNVRELRRHVSRRIVGLQEILDAISDTRSENWDGYLKDWDDIVAGIEKEACNDKGGGHDMEKFCAEHLGFQCLQQFLRDQ
ncbi:hypothetical protein ACJIZ3_006698 [Penstemon smallii]|uniref:BAG domain-containing protein n=1 Tax=Penstemon smallii TaxID=265156 RepID=A0ABD3S8G8_9LAMI